MKNKITLIEGVTLSLMDRGHPNPRAWLSDPIVAQVAAEEYAAQREVCQAFWTNKIEACGVWSIMPRYVLRQMCAQEEYLKLFSDNVAKFIVDNKL